MCEYECCYCKKPTGNAGTTFQNCDYQDQEFCYGICKYCGDDFVDWQCKCCSPDILINS